MWYVVQYCTSLCWYILHLICALYCCKTLQLMTCTVISCRSVMSWYGGISQVLCSQKREWHKFTYKADSCIKMIMKWIWKLHIFTFHRHQMRAAKIIKPRTKLTTMMKTFTSVEGFWVKRASTTTWIWTTIRYSIICNIRHYLQHVGPWQVSRCF